MFQEYFGELLEQTLNGVAYLAESYPNRGFEELLARVRHTAHYFLFYSVIVAKQPPSVIVKCGEAENHRRSRFWFNTEIRVLGGRAFGLHKNAENSNVQCYLITDDTAKRLLSDAYHDVYVSSCMMSTFEHLLIYRYENEEFMIEPPLSALHADDMNALSAKFDDMVGIDCISYSSISLPICSALPRRDSFDETRWQQRDIVSATTFA